MQKDLALISLWYNLSKFQAQTSDSWSVYISVYIKGDTEQGDLFAEFGDCCIIFHGILSINILHPGTQYNGD